MFKNQIIDSIIDIELVGLDIEGVEIDPGKITFLRALLGGIPILTTLVIPYESGAVILNPTEYVYLNGITYALTLKFSDSNPNMIIGEAIEVN